MNSYPKKFLDWKARKGWAVYQLTPEVTYWNPFKSDKILTIEQLYELYKKEKWKGHHVNSTIKKKTSG